MHYGWIDSWWYVERLHRGVSLWEDITTRPPDFSDMRQRFPSSLTGMTRKTGRKVVAHIERGMWTRHTRGMRPTASWLRGSHTLPTSHSFWQELMGNAADWGLLVMKQDHINENIQGKMVQCYRAVTVLATVSSAKWKRTFLEWDERRNSEGGRGALPQGHTPCFSFYPIRESRFFRPTSKIPYFLP